MRIDYDREKERQNYLGPLALNTPDPSMSSWHWPGLRLAHDAGEVDMSDYAFKSRVHLFHRAQRLFRSARMFSYNSC